MSEVRTGRTELVTNSSLTSNTKTRDYKRIESDLVPTESSPVTVIRSLPLQTQTKENKRTRAKYRSKEDDKGDEKQRK